MSLDADDCDVFVKNKLFRTRGKCEIYARQSDVFVAVKQKSTLRATTPSVADGNNSSTVINVRHDIWFHIAMRIDPEDVQTFALICKETARLVASRAFWQNLYRRHCIGATAGWNLDLPAQLQLEQIRNCDTRALRSLVIKALFHCHQPLKIRMELGYHLDWLLERIFMSCWLVQYKSLWIMCYKFSNCHPHVQIQDESDAEEHFQVVNNWEALVEDDAGDQLSPVQGNTNQGVVLLIVVCGKFVPTPTQLSYGQQGTRYRLRGTRELLCSDMRGKNLELDFAEDRSQSVALTVKYPRIIKYKVLPWWHPDFPSFVK